MMGFLVLPVVCEAYINSPLQFYFSEVSLNIIIQANFRSFSPSEIMRRINIIIREKWKLYEHDNPDA